MPKALETSLAAVATVGRSTIDVVKECGGVTLLIWETCYFAFVAPFRGVFPDREAVGKQLAEEGVNSVPIVALLTWTVGLILAMNTVYYLGKLGAADLMPVLISYAMVRELGPLISSIIISGRVGASVAAELGTMKVAEEIDALTSMALHPTRFLVVPRIGALFLMLPCLGLLASGAGIFGAYCYGAMKLDMTATEFRRLAFNSMVPADVWTGVVKTFVFAIIINGIACFKGLTVSGGAEGVGRATTETVVHSIFAIILADGLFTVIFTLFFP